MTKDEALKQAREALLASPTSYRAPKTIAAIEEALAQPEHGWTPERIAGIARLKDAQDKKLAQRTWVGLTDEEILAVNMSTVTKLIDEPIVCDTDHNIVQLGKAIEAKLKEKNT